MIAGIISGGAAHPIAARIITAGTLLASCCATVDGSVGFDEYDPTNTLHPKWETNFKSFIDDGAYAYKKVQSVEVPSITDTVTSTVHRFVSGEEWKFFGYCATWPGDDVQVDVEFLSGGAVLAAVGIRKNVIEYSCAIKAGPTIETMEDKPRGYGYTQVNGTLVATEFGIQFTPNLIAQPEHLNTYAFTYSVDLTGADAVRFTTKAKSGYNGGGAAYGGVMMINDSPF